MEFYHVKIITQEDKKEQINDLSQQDLLTKIVKPYEQGKGIFINGTNINSLEITKIFIGKTRETYKEVSDRIHQQDMIEIQRYKQRGIAVFPPSNYYHRAFGKGEDVLDEFILGPPGYKVYKKSQSMDEAPSSQESNKIFIVHGHNEEMKQSTARFLERFNLEPIILHEQPNKGRTIIEKFSDYSDVAYAIVLLSADDMAYVKNDSSDNAKYRARQNVILELGYFLGKLGRNRVAAIYEEGKNIEIPSDFSGVLYIPYSGNDSWKLHLAKELKASNFEIDMNKI